MSVPPQTAKVGEKSSTPAREPQGARDWADWKWHEKLTAWASGLFWRAFFRIYGHWHVIGLENVPKTGGVLLASNHTSYLDPPIGWAALLPRRRPWAVAKSELWNSRAMGYWVRCMGAIPVRRGTADRAMIRRVLDLLAQGEAVGVFPEGTRSPDGTLQPAQPGVALLVQKSHVPVVPACILGTFTMFPTGAKKLKRARLTVAFGPPLTFPPEATREEILNGIMAGIAAVMTANGQPTTPPTQTALREEA